MSSSKTLSSQIYVAWCRRSKWHGEPQPWVFVFRCVRSSRGEPSYSAGTDFAFPV